MSDAGPVSPNIVSADYEVLCKLTRAGFSGMEWDRLVAELFNYSYQRLRAWIRTGRMFTECQYGLPRNGPISWDLADDLAIDTLAEASPAFRAEVLIAGRWKPDRGTTVTSFFIGFCKLKFPNVYRRHFRSDQRWIRALE